jgi:hypothetical protein
MPAFTGTNRHNDQLPQLGEQIPLSSERQAVTIKRIYLKIGYSESKKVFFKIKLGRGNTKKQEIFLIL